MSKFMLSFTMATMAMAMTVVSLVVPSPYLIMEPGPALDVGSMIAVPDQYRQEHGRIYLTSVSLRSATLSQWAVAHLDPASRILPREEIEPQDVSPADLNRVQVELLEESKAVAQIVALEELGYDVEMSGQGAKVEAVLPTSPARDKLEPGDTIIGLNGRQVQTATELVNSIRKVKPGEIVGLMVLRGSQRLDFASRTIESTSEPGQAMLGVLITTDTFEYKPPFDIHIDTENLAGPSAGLMFTLGIIDALTPGDLTRGHKIAGTGTIAIDGAVGKIDGATQKVGGAERAGAEVFFSPEENYEEAKAAARRLTVVQVKTVEDALRYLVTLGGDLPDKEPAGAAGSVNRAIAG